MKPALSCALSALLLVACVEPGEVPESETLAPATHDPAEAAANESDPGTEPLASAATVVLQNGVPLTGLSGARNAKQSFTFVVPAGASQLAFQMNGGTGDADIFVRFGSAPTTSTYDYRPYLNGNDERVAPPAATAGTWYVMINGYTAYTGVSLVASFTSGTAPPPPPPPMGGPDCTNAASWPADWVAFEDQVLVLVNQRRAAGAICGGVPKPAVAALAMDAALRQAARCHSLDMAQHNYFSHDSQDGRSPWDRIRNAGYTGFGNAENIAAGQNSPASVVDTWMSSTGHCNNIMTSGSNELGVGYAYDAAGQYGRYWTQDFGQR